MVDGTTLRVTNITDIPLNYITQVANMVRALSNKYVPILSIDEVKINLLQSLKDFCYRARKCATMIKLQENPT